MTKRLGYVIIIKKEINTFIQQECIKLINSDSKDIYKMLQKISNKSCLLNSLFIEESVKKNSAVSMKILSSTTGKQHRKNRKCFLSALPSQEQITIYNVLK